MSRKIGWCEGFPQRPKSAIPVVSDSGISRVSYDTDPCSSRSAKKKKISIETIATSDLSEETSPELNVAAHKSTVSYASEKWSIHHLKAKFKEANIEDLYARYCLRIQRSLFLWLLAVLIAYNVLLVCLFNTWFSTEQLRERSVPASAVTNVVLGLGVVFAVVCVALVAIKRVFLKLHRLITAGVFVCLIISAVSFTGFSFANRPHSKIQSLDDVPMTMFIIFVIHSMFPLSRLASVLIGIVVSITSLSISAILYNEPAQIIIHKIVANFFIYLSVNFTGLYHKHLTDIAHRQTFLDTRRFIETDLKYSRKRTMQNHFRESLLRQIIPSYLIEDMKNVLGKKLIHESAVDPQQFVDFYADDKRHPRSSRPMPDEHAMRKILQKLLKKRMKGPTNQFYTLIVKRHDDVSILFADIVQFTRLTEQLTPIELIKTLNALFGRFDKIAQKNKCMRIKILGDCYYCVSGLPDPTPDHAKCCVTMALEMIRIIREVRDETGVARLDMRIGIHTGYVLSGVLGLHKWQYDVWSDDVYIANQMEANGRPGHVHVTQSILDRLPDVYDTETGNQNEFLRVNDIKTYFIVPKEAKVQGMRFSAGKGRRKSIVVYMRDWATENPFDCLTNYIENTAQGGNEQQEINSRLSDCFYLSSASVTHDPGKWLKSSCKDIKHISLVFRSARKEKMYRHSRDPAFHLGIGCCMFVFVCMGVAQGFALITRFVPLMSFFITGTVLFITLFLLSNPSVNETGPLKTLKRCSWYIMKTIYLKFALTLFCLTLTFVGSVFSVGSCRYLTKEEVQNVSQEIIKGPNVSLYYFAEQHGVCVFSVYYLYSCMLAFICCSVFLRLNFIIKILFMFVELVIYSVMFHWKYSYIFDFYNTLIGGSMMTVVEVRGGIYLLISFITLAVLNRQTEKSLRLAFLWKTKIKEEKLRVVRSDWLNTLLLENILPRHVADHYFEPGATKSLYYQSHDSVCVLFASIPDIKSTGVTGRECLRLLNEVIAAFDQLLMTANFKLVEKIKTIGSTYMAAVGLKPDSVDSNVDENVVLTVKFCLQMMEKLSQINKDSFSENKLRIGINHGPVVAGVIGAHKPQYDILGDTVNVASRMESHGVAGRIQVRRETMEILERNGFPCEYRDRINIKGKEGLLDVYMVKERASLRRLDSHASSVEITLSPALSRSTTFLHDSAHHM